MGQVLTKPIRKKKKIVKESRPGLYRVYSEPQKKEGSKKVSVIRDEIVAKSKQDALDQFSEKHKLVAKQAFLVRKQTTKPSDVKKKTEEKKPENKKDSK